MVGDIGQPTHLHYDMFYFYTSGLLLIGVCWVLRYCCVCSMCCHSIIPICLWYDIIDITRLLHMIYVLWLVLYGNSSRAVAAIWLCTLCDRYSITFILPAFL